MKMTLLLPSFTILERHADGRPKKVSCKVDGCSWTSVANQTRMEEHLKKKSIPTPEGHRRNLLPPLRRRRCQMKHRWPLSNRQRSSASRKFRLFWIENCLQMKMRHALMRKHGWSCSQGFRLIANNILPPCNSTRHCDRHSSRCRGVKCRNAIESVVF